MTPMTQLIQERILRLKQEKNACILAHCYQTHDILEVADYVGDSFGLAQNASKTDCSTVIMCGVRFMAETVKILSPEKRVLLPKAEAGCPMAEQLDPEMLRQLQAAQQIQAALGAVLAPGQSGGKQPECQPGKDLFHLVPPYFFIKGISPFLPFFSFFLFSGSRNGFVCEARPPETVFLPFRLPLIAFPVI